MGGGGWVDGWMDKLAAVYIEKEKNVKSHRRETVRRITENHTFTENNRKPLRKSSL